MLDEDFICDNDSDLWDDNCRYADMQEENRSLCAIDDIDDDFDEDTSWMDDEPEYDFPEPRNWEDDF